MAFVFGLGATCAVLRHTTAAPPVPEYSEKLARYARDRAHIDTLFLGSSRVRRGISPRLFDETTAALGRPTRSFNFGLDGMGHPELPYVLDQILALQPGALRCVVLELTRFVREFGPQNQPDSLRIIYWHTTGYTWLNCRAVWEDPAQPPVARRLTVMAQHAGIWARRESNLGRGQPLLEAAPAPKPQPNAGLGPEGTGFFQVPDRFPPEKIPGYLLQLEQARSRAAAPVQTDRVFEHATYQMLAKLRQHNIQVIVLVMPRIFPQPPWVPEVGPYDDIWRFDDPDANAALFDASVRYDAQHLNVDGADLFSRELAKRHVSWARRALD